MRPVVALQSLIVVPLCPILLHQKASKAASLLALWRIERNIIISLAT
nr:MAG TPA: hypothetical protein [Caudoviricetes sp.]